MKKQVQNNYNMIKVEKKHEKHTNHVNTTSAS